jgi:hypothetical protein
MATVLTLKQGGRSEQDLGRLYAAAAAALDDLAGVLSADDPLYRAVPTLAVCLQGRAHRCSARGGSV